MVDILITDSKTIREIQHEFNAAFPFLKLEFFDEMPVENKSLPKSKMFTNDKRLGAIRAMHNESKITITRDEKVAALERKLWEVFGLSAQVFRKSGNLWIETSLTDNWTLEQQNREGFEMSSQDKNPFNEANDIDLPDRDKWE